jgi:hypothetical protein
MINFDIMNIVAIFGLWLCSGVLTFLFMTLFKVDHKSSLLLWLRKNDDSMLSINSIFLYLAKSFGIFMLFCSLGLLIWFDLPITAYRRKQAAHRERMKADLHYARQHKLKNFLGTKTIVQ